MEYYMIQKPHPNKDQARLKSGLSGHSGACLGLSLEAGRCQRYGVLLATQRLRGSRCLYDIEELA